MLIYSTRNRFYQYQAFNSKEQLSRPKIVFWYQPSYDIMCSKSHIPVQLLLSKVSYSQQPDKKHGHQHPTTHRLQTSHTLSQFYAIQLVGQNVLLKTSTGTKAMLVSGLNLCVRSQSTSLPCAPSSPFEQTFHLVIFSIIVISAAKRSFLGQRSFSLKVSVSAHSFTCFIIHFRFVPFVAGCQSPNKAVLQSVIRMFSAITPNQF